MVQLKQMWLASMRTQVQSLASLSGLEIWHCCELWCRLQTWLKSRVTVAAPLAGSYSSDSTFAWEPPNALGAALKRPQKKKKKKKELLFWFLGPTRSVSQHLIHYYLVESRNFTSQPSSWPSPEWPLRLWSGEHLVGNMGGSLGLCSLRSPPQPTCSILQGMIW